MSRSDFRFSALLAALGRMWRTTGIALPAVVLNAVVQALLIWAELSGGLVWVGVAISGLVAAGTSVALIAAGLGATSDHSEPGPLIRDHGLRGLGWVLVVWLATLLGSLIYTVGGFVVAALLLFVPVAAVAGRDQPLRSGLHTIRTQFGRWVATVIALALVAGVLWLLLVAGSFFLFSTQVLSSLILWVLLGVVAWWIATALALIYRRTPTSSDSLRPAAP